MAIYRGFSTAVSAKKYTLTDFELAKRDLLNYFSIRKGSKLMQPSFGSLIWDQLFEPLNESTRNVITSDIKKIVSYDPRLAINNVTVTEQTNGIQIELFLRYIPSDQTETLTMNFDRDAATLTTN